MAESIPLIFGLFLKLKAGISGSMFYKQQKIFWWLALFTTLFGLGASAYLTNLHFSILKIGFSSSTLCNISSYLNCNNVLASRFASIGTIPLAGIGGLFYLYLLGTLIYARVASEDAAKILSLPYLGVILSVVLSLLLALESTLNIRSLCVFCTTLYATNLLLLIFTKKVMAMKFSEWLSNLTKISWPKAIGVLAGVFLIGGVLLHTTHKQFAKDIPQEKLDQYLAAYMKLPIKEINTDGRPYWGNKDAKISIVEFSDFECPYCKRAAFQLKAILKNFQDDIKFFFFQYPLDSKCNERITRNFHRYACQTAYASYCADQQGKFWEYHDKAFARQPKFHQASLENIATKVGLDLEKFKTCLESEKAKAHVQEDLKQGRNLGVRGTPAVFVNGRPFQPWPSKKAWVQLIKYLKNQ